MHSLLLQKLNGFILENGERLTTFCTRLAEVFQELENLDGAHAMTFTDTQKLTYLLKAIRHEPHLEAARVYLQSEMNRGTMTYDLALRDLRLRDETKRAEEAFDTATPRALGTRRRGYLANQDSNHPSPQPWDRNESSSDLDYLTEGQLNALVTTVNKRLNQPTATAKQSRLPTNARDGTLCLVLGCKEMCAMPICRLHFATMACGKESALVLRNGYGKVTYNKEKNQAIYPST